MVSLQGVQITQQDEKYEINGLITKLSVCPNHSLSSTQVEYCACSLFIDKRILVH